jgi:aminoglycoside phosphotransferase (APT) family kinase protein
VTDGSSRTLLAGGYRNRVWKVRRGRETLIEKDYAEDPGHPNPMYPNLPDHEAAALRYLSGTGCAPELIAYRPVSARAGAVVLYRYEPGTQWRKGVGDVARLLFTVHHLPAPPGLRQLHRSAVEAIAHADAMVAATPGRRARTSLAAARPLSSAHELVPRPALVHTDCGPGNLVRTRHGLVLIDWQCPGVGDPVEDLACFLSPAMMILYSTPPHTARARATFLDAYPDAATVSRYLCDGASWHYRIAAYCLWRSHRTARWQPEVSQRYREALVAETGLLGSWA